MEIKSRLRKKKTLARTNQDSNILGIYFRRNNVGTQLNLKEKVNLDILRLFFIKIRSIHIMSTSYSTNQSSFFPSVEINKPLSTPIRNLIKFKVESTTISINSYIKDSIMRKVINILQEMSMTKYGDLGSTSIKWLLLQRLYIQNHFDPTITEK